MTYKKITIITAVTIYATFSHAAVPVYDAATNAAASRTATNTATIIDLNKDILETVNATLQSFTGERKTEASAFENSALGDSFNFGQAPSFSDLMGSFSIDFGDLSVEFQTNAADLINGFELVESLSGLVGENLTTNDKAYKQAINSISQVAGIISGVEKASKERTERFKQNSQNIGSASDVKGSIDQNSQLAIQTGQSVNELIGVMNTVSQSVNMQNIGEIQARSEANKFMSNDVKWNPFK